MPSGDAATTSNLQVLDPSRVRLRRDELGRLRLEVGIEERYGPVRAVRCLPLTQPERFISLQDEEGEELGVIGDLAELDAASAQAVRAELELSYLHARVTRIHHVEARNGIITWEVTTDLGKRRVHVRDRQNIRPLPGGRTVLTDIHDGKYEIPAAEELDKESRRWLEIEL
ncbi:MAG: DUF1854 domain-containing protein [Actinomycetota bacterium]